MARGNSDAIWPLAQKSGRLLPTHSVTVSVFFSFLGVEDIQDGIHQELSDLAAADFDLLTRLPESGAGTGLLGFVQGISVYWVFVANDLVLLDIFDQVEGVLDDLGAGFLGAGAGFAVDLEDPEKACPQVIGFQADTPLESSARTTVDSTIPSPPITRTASQRPERRRARRNCFMMITPTRNLPTNPSRTVAGSVRKVSGGIKVKK